MNEQRYIRQISMPEIGIEGQLCLSRARVLIVGVGGLGAPIALYLAAAGVGRIGIVDDDCVSLSNIQRQIIYDEKQVGAPKVKCAAERLRALNEDVCVVEYNCRLTADNAEAIIADYDYVVDGCDNYATRYVIDSVCSRLKIPYVYGAIGSLEGQVAVFAYRSACTYSRLYPCMPNSESDKLNSVMGSTPAIVGTIMAHQVLQLICGFGSPLVDTLMIIDLRSLEFNKIRL